MAVLFLILNAPAYTGYFQDDELDIMGWAPFVRASDFVRGLASPRFIPSNFRPVGHYYYHLLTILFHLHFAAFVIPLQMTHLLNLKTAAIFIGAVFYIFNAALMDVYWKPMYVFDVLCTTFCLLSLLLWLHKRWILSFVAFWFAYKSKELAVMLPFVIATYEFVLGQKLWKPLIPFFLASLSFGLQGLLLNPNKDNAYTFRFQLGALAKTASFYSSKLFSLRLAGLALLPLPFVVRDRRIWFGVSTAILLLIPLLFLPGLAALLILWLPWNMIQFHRARLETLRLEKANRAYVAELERFARSTPTQRSFVYDGRPEGFHPWGVAGAISCVYRAVGQQVLYIDDPSARQRVERGEAVWLHWDPSVHELQIRTPVHGDQLPPF
ncbi:MAG: hypothetical protein DMG58_07365 [Acidobacteria bacterium]|nr:MAG: hypothetical protein DMG58_07365 [Acidobacteriota bacterium]